MSIETVHLPTVLSDHTVDLSGRVAAITGTTSGTGYVCARELARLGARVLLSALTGIAEPLPNLHHIVFAGAAAPAQAYSQMPAWVCNSESDRAIHVWSENDFVLQAMYPLMQGACPAAGRAPVNIPGVKNVNVKVGHLGYSAIAKELLSIAVTD